MVAIRSVRVGLEEFPWPDMFELRSYSQYLPISTGYLPAIYRQRYIVWVGIHRVHDENNAPEVL